MEYLPGSDNQTADGESRTCRDRSNWKLNPSVFRVIQQQMDPLKVDLFASCLATLLLRFYSWCPDPEAEAIDAFTQNWALSRRYAYPPWCLISKCLFQETTASKDSANNSLVNNPILVSNSPGIAKGLPMSSPKQSRSHNSASRETVHNGSGSLTADRMAHLWSTFSS